MSIAAPVLALAGGVTAYALACGVTADNFDQSDTYQLNLSNGLIGAAGLVGGAILPSLFASCRGAIRSLWDRSVARVQVAQEAPAQVIIHAAPKVVPRD